MLNGVQKANYRRRPSDPRAKTLFSVTSDQDVHVPLLYNVDPVVMVDKEFLLKFDNEWMMNNCLSRDHDMSLALTVEEDKVADTNASMLPMEEDVLCSTPLTIVLSDEDKVKGDRDKKKAALPATVRRSGRLISLGAINTFAKADMRAVVKSLEVIEAPQNGASNILGSTHVKILFDACSRDQLLHLGSQCGINLHSSSSSFDIAEKLRNMERSRADALNCQK